MKRRWRWIRAVGLTACLLVMAAAAVGWICSHTAGRALLYPRAAAERQPAPFAAYLFPDGIILYRATDPQLLRISPGGALGPMTSEKGRIRSTQLWGVYYRAIDLRSATFESLAIRFWLIIALAGVVPGSWLITLVWRRQRRHRRDPHAVPCPHCGYDLRATPHRCPECGAVPVKRS